MVSLLRIKKTRVSTRFLLMLSISIVLLGVISIFLINIEMKSHARKEAQEKAMMLLDKNIAVHTYFSHQLKPALFDKIDTSENNKYFDPAWMSSTYAVREIHKYYSDISEKEYYYKEAAVNARNPENEADEIEKEFIEKINKSSDIKKDSSIRKIGNKTYFVTLRRGETMEKSCLRCHSKPEQAPKDLVSEYGSQRSFDRDLGEVVSAISVRIPLNEAYSDINKVIIKFSALFTSALLIIFGLALFFGKRWIFNPLESIQKKTDEISQNYSRLGEQIELPSGYEFSKLTEKFNFMSAELRKEKDFLESRVASRTNKLNKTNKLLSEEIDKHKKTIKHLESSLEEIQTLRGILPICMHCKKIRDDEGYWNKIETYISEHSQAELSHGICDDCVSKYYSEDFDPDKDK
ncbi:MAG: c-type heme family protein [Thermodesulfobacteriota bacterium]